MNIGPDTVLDIDKSVYLTNYKNKQSFINHLRTELEKDGINTRASSDDADRDVVCLAIDKLQYSDVTVYGDDSDLIVLILHHADVVLKSGHTLYYHTKSEIWNMNQLISKSKTFPFVSRILVVHAFLGCDTTSRINGVGKDRFLKTRELDFWELFDIFIEYDINPVTIAEYGRKIMLKIYKAKEEMDLNDLRATLFQKENLKKISANDMKNKQQLADCKTLPPTDDTSSHHSLRVYHQVQTWLGNILSPIDWGWLERSGKYVPQMTSAGTRIAPNRVLDLVNCSCTKGCNNARCSCV